MLSTAQDPNSHCFWFWREVEEIRHHVHEQTIRDYVDIIDMIPALDTTLTLALDVLRDERIPQVVLLTIIYIILCTYILIIYPST